MAEVVMPKPESSPFASADGARLLETGDATGLPLSVETIHAVMEAAFAAHRARVPAKIAPIDSADFMGPGPNVVKMPLDRDPHALPPQLADMVAPSTVVWYPNKAK